MQYDEYKSPMDNIGMQDSLLSRFDIIFVVLDEMDPDSDRRISEHVLRMHRYRNPAEQVRGGGISMDFVLIKNWGIGVFKWPKVVIIPQ